MRIGVAGAGLIGRRHVALIEASPDCVVAGIADYFDVEWQREAGGGPILVNLVHALAVPTMELWSDPGASGWCEPLQRSDAATAAQDPLVEQLRHFRAVIARRETPLISVEDAMCPLAVVEAVKQAARTGKRISPNQLVEQAA